MPFKSFKISGNDYQKTSEASSNVLDLKKLEVYKLSTNTTYDISNSNSIKVTAGTGNSYQNVAFKLDLEDGDYIGYLGSAETSNTEMTIKRMTISEYVDNVRTALKHIDVGNNNNNTFTITNAENKVYALEFWGNYSTNIENTTTYDECYIAKGTSFSAYEEFTPDMPSTKYESPVRACGDNIQLFDKDNVNKVSNYIDNSGYFQYNATTKMLYMECEKNKDYVVSSKYLRGIAFLNEVPKAGVTSTNFKIQNTTELTLNSGDNTYLIVWYYASACTLTEQEVLDSIKICKGTSTGGYSEFGQGSMTIKKSNKNLFDGELEKGIINTTSGINEHNDWSAVRSKNYINVNGLTEITLSLINNSNTVVFFDKYKNVLSYNSTTNSNKRTVTLPENCAYIRYYEWVVDYTSARQIEEGTTATEVVPHEEKEHIVPTQQPMYEGDGFVKVDGVRYEKHNFKIYILNGTENINNWQNLDNGGYGFYFYKDDIVSYSNWIMPDLTCNAFKIVRGSDINNSTFSKPCMSTWGKNIFVKIPIETIGGTSENTHDELNALLKTWLAEQCSNGTPIYIVYPLAEPIFIPCTEDQNAILDEIEQDENYKNITHIYSEDEISQTFDVEYYKDRETTEKNLEDRITALEELLSTTATSAMLLDNMQTDLESEV